MTVNHAEETFADPAYAGTVSADLDAIADEVARLEKLFGKSPIRIEVGCRRYRAIMADVPRAPGDSRNLPIGYELRGTPVMLGATLGPNEWSLVFR